MVENVVVVVRVESRRFEKEKEKGKSRRGGPLKSLPGTVSFRTSRRR